MPNGGETELGFTRMYESLTFFDPPPSHASTPMSASVETFQGSGDPALPIAQSVDLTTLLGNLFAASDARFTVAGYSLGGALAILHGAVLGGTGSPVDVYTFAAPMVGDETFVQSYSSVVQESYAIENKPDIVSHLPGTLLGYAPDVQRVEVNSLEFPELRHTISCFHHLYTYLYVLGDHVDISSCKA